MSEAAAAVVAPAAAAHEQQQQDADVGPSRVLVYVRERPARPKELSEVGVYRLISLAPNMVTVDGEKNYSVDHALGPSADQKAVFEAVCKPNVFHALKGHTSTVLCYGQTGTGKSFTMCNYTPDRPEFNGCLPRAAETLFEQVELCRDSKDITVEIQFIQIYRDHCGDLLSPSGNDRVDMHFDMATGVTFPGCSTHRVNTVDELLERFTTGFKSRVTVATSMNPESSRGHAAFVIWITSRSTTPGNIETRRGKLNFIDLAGYERFSKTGISNNDPVRKDEAKTINASLLSLGHVVTALSNGDKHIPWRNSKLTRMLQDSIGGRSRTTMVLTIGPSSEHLHETTNTLQFGQRAMAVRVESKVKVIVDWQKHALKLQALLDEKTKRVEELQEQLAACAAAESEMILRQQKDIDALRDKHAEEIAALAEAGASEERLQTLRQQQGVEVELLITQQAEERAYEEEKLDREERDGSDSGESESDKSPTTTSAQAASTAAEQQQQPQQAQQDQQQTATTDAHAEPSNNSFLDQTYSPRNMHEKSKDEQIAELKRQVRLYKMKLLVPEKYRAASDIVEHEALAGTVSGERALAAFGQGGGSSAAPSGLSFGGGADVVSRAEFEAMRRTLENELDNRDQLLAQQLDLQSFAAAANVGAKDDKKTSNNNENIDEKNRVADYIASLHRRVSDLTERLDHERKHRSHHHHNQQQGGEAENTGSAKQEEQQTSATASSPALTSEEATTLKTQLEKLQTQITTSNTAALRSLSSALLDAKQRTLDSVTNDLLAHFLSGFTAITTKFDQETQFLQTELETAKVEMNMALEGQNESLMEAIDNARNEAAAEFNAQKLSWAEETEDRIDVARRQAWDEARREQEDSQLLLQAELAKLRQQIAERDTEISNLRSQAINAAEDAAEAQARADAATEAAKKAQEETSKAKQQAAATTAASSKTATTPTSATHQPSQQNQQSPPSKSPQSQSQQQAPLPGSPLPTPTPAQFTQQTQQPTAAQRAILDDLDSVLMPVLKTKTQLLDDITEVLASTASTMNMNNSSFLGDGFDFIPDIPLVSARGGGGTMNAAGGTYGSIDPHASLSNFVKAIQHARSGQQQQQQYPDPDASIASFVRAVQHGKQNQQGMSTDLTRGESDDGSGGLTAAGGASAPAASSSQPPAGIPKLSLGGLKAPGAAAASNSNTPGLMSPTNEALATGRMTGRSNAQQQQQQGGSLPANLPATLMRIIKRMRESASDAETKWMKCIVALSKISKHVAILTSNAAAAGMTQQQQQQTATARTAKVAADIMNCVNAALLPTQQTADATTKKQPQQRPNISEAEAARRSLGNSLIQQSVVAGETGLAEQQALQSVVMSQQEQLQRGDEEVVGLAVDLARAKLSLRFEKQILLALGMEGTSGEEEARKAIVEFETVAHEQQQQLQQEQQQTATKSPDQEATENSELTYYKLKAAMLEQKLRSQLAELARAQQMMQQAAGGAHAGSSVPSVSTKTAAMREQEMQREIHAASASIVTDMDLITSCREAELRVLSARLERVERENLALRKNRDSFSTSLAGNNKQQAAGSRGGQQSAAATPGGGSGITSTAEAVFYHILRNLRKENSILHSVIRERGLQLRKFALTLMRHQLLPPAFNVEKLAGDVHSELRLAFAERDEEIFLKEQALAMRSTQVIVLEESLGALMDQLQRADMTPCRPPSKFGAELQRARDEIKAKMGAKSQNREELRSKIERIKSELERVEQRMQQAQQQQQQEKHQGASGGPVSTHALAAQASASDNLLVLRLQKDHLSHTKQISEVQLGALESELALLQQSLLSASSTAAIEAGIETRDVQENTSVLSKLFSFGKK